MIRTAAVALALAFGLAAPPPAGADGEGNPGSGYTVREGQTLSTIAHDVLGDPGLWPAIYWANRDQIKDPTILHVGQRLMIPEVTHEAAERERIRREAVALAGPPEPPAGPDVAAAPSDASPRSTTE